MTRSNSNIVRYGARAPESLVVDVSPSAADGTLPDLSAVTSAVLRVQGPSGFATWACTLTYPASPQYPTRLRLAHLFTEQDLPGCGVYTVVPTLTATGYQYPVRCEPVQFEVVPEFDAR